VENGSGGIDIYFFVQPVTMLQASVLLPKVHDCGMHIPAEHSVLLWQSWNSLVAQAVLQTALTVVIKPTLTATQHTPPSQSPVSSQYSESLCVHGEPFALHVPAEPPMFSQQ
jgi:hypothetical protein